jgi:hypothetical protein
MCNCSDRCEKCGAPVCRRCGKYEPRRTYPYWLYYPTWPYTDTTWTGSATTITGNDQTDCSGNTIRYTDAAPQGIALCDCD